MDDRSTPPRPARPSRTRRLRGRGRVPGAERLPSLWALGWTLLVLARALAEVADWTRWWRGLSD